MSPSESPALACEGLCKAFRVRRGTYHHALRDVSMHAYPGETVAVVGESGSGKSTLGRALLRLIDVDSGRVLLGGADVTRRRGRDLDELRRSAQLVPQDPYSSLNPRMTVDEIVREPVLVMHGRAAAKRADLSSALAQVGLEAAAVVDQRPRELSGGQRQRILIARALINRPTILVSDEPVASLDVSTQAGIIDLLKDVQQALRLAHIFVSHDMSVVQQIADRVIVMQGGQIVESGSMIEVTQDPQHPYTQRLIACVPRLTFEHAAAQPTPNHRQPTTSKECDLQ